MTGRSRVGKMSMAMRCTARTLPTARAATAARTVNGEDAADGQGSDGCQDRNRMAEGEDDRVERTHAASFRGATCGGTFQAEGVRPPGVIPDTECSRVARNQSDSV